MVVKSDGATKYETRDLAAAIYRKKIYDFHKNLYVVNVQQTEHFRGLFGALEKAGYPWAKDCLHIPFGIMKLKEGDAVLPMSTRGGTMIPLAVLLDRMVGVVEGIVEEKNPGLGPEKKRAVAEAVGVGAIVFWVQSRRRASNILFDWKSATNPDGDTGPYIQYTHARACSILKNHGGPLPERAALALLVEREEAELVKQLGAFPGAVAQAAQEFEPSIVATWLIQTAQAFNLFHHHHHVLKAAPGLKEARLILVAMTRDILAKGMALIGVPGPEEM
jgi:arginyl-tRNA synthetase